VLAKKGPLGKIWLAAHMGEKKVPKVQIMGTDIPDSVKNIEEPAVPMALRVSGHLLLGVVRIFSRKVAYLMTDCSEAMLKIKDSFRAGEGGSVQLAPGAATSRFENITNLDEMDLDAEFPSQVGGRPATPHPAAPPSLSPLPSRRPFPPLPRPRSHPRVGPPA